MNQQQERQLRARFGRRIQQLRKAKKLTQVEAARTGGLDSKWWAQMEGGRRNPTFLSIVKMSRALAVEPFELLLFDAGGEGSDRLSDQEIISRLLKNSDVRARQLVMNLLNDVHQAGYGSKRR